MAKEKDSYGIGEFEELVMLAIIRQGNDTYRIRIWETIEEDGGRPTALTAIYTVLERLEKKKFVTVKAVTDTEGKKKKHYSVTGTGQIALQKAESTRQRLRDGFKGLKGAQHVT